MLTFKKTYLDGTKLLVVIFIAITALFGLAALVGYQHQDFMIFLSSGYHTFYQLSLFFGLAYPVFALKCIAPRKGKFLDAQVGTSILPLTKKQLLLKAMKPWFITFPLYMLGSTIVYAFIEANMLEANVATMLVMGGLLYLVFGGLSISGLVLQIMAIVILYLAKQQRGIKVISKFLVLDLVTFMIGSGIIELLQLDTATDMSWMFIIFGLFLFVSLATFIYAFRFIEKIYQ
ncbi:MAG: hypothetical protein ACRCS6_12670 [Turicibacter sp.]